MGYRLCAFLDADEPLEIFRRLIVGSEGTLAFVAEAVFDTVPLGAHDASRWSLFADIDAAAERSRPGRRPGASATELMVAPTLIAAALQHARHARALEGAAARERPRCWSSSAADDDGELDEPERRGAGDPRGARAARRRPRFTREREEIEMLWRVREGMHGLVGGDARRPACR